MSGNTDFENNFSVYSKPINRYTPINKCPFFTSHNTFIPKQKNVNGTIPYMGWMEDQIDFIIELCMKFPVSIEFDLCFSTQEKNKIYDLISRKEIGKDTKNATFYIGHWLNDIKQSTTEIYEVDLNIRRLPYFEIKKTPRVGGGYSNLNINNKYFVINQLKTKKKRRINKFKTKKKIYNQEGGNYYKSWTGYKISTVFNLIIRKYILAKNELSKKGKCMFPLMILIDHASKSLLENHLANQKYVELFQHIIYPTDEYIEKIILRQVLKEHLDSIKSLYNFNIYNYYFEKYNTHDKKFIKLQLVLGEIKKSIINIIKPDIIKNIDQDLKTYNLNNFQNKFDTLSNNNTIFKQPPVENDRTAVNTQYDKLKKYFKDSSKHLNVGLDYDIFRLYVICSICFNLLDKENLFNFKKLDDILSTDEKKFYEEYKNRICYLKTTKKILHEQLLNNSKEQARQQHNLFVLKNYQQDNIMHEPLYKFFNKIILRDKNLGYKCFTDKICVDLKKKPFVYSSYTLLQSQKNLLQISKNKLCLFENVKCSIPIYKIKQKKQKKKLEIYKKVSADFSKIYPGVKLFYHETLDPFFKLLLIHIKLLNDDNDDSSRNEKLGKLHKIYKKFFKNDNIYTISLKYLENNTPLQSPPPSSTPSTPSSPSSPPSTPSTPSSPSTPQIPTLHSPISLHVVDPKKRKSSIFAKSMDDENRIRNRLFSQTITNIAQGLGDTLEVEFNNVTSITDSNSSSSLLSQPLNITYTDLQIDSTKVFSAPFNIELLNKITNFEQLELDDYYSKLSLCPMIALNIDKYKYSDNDTDLIKLTFIKTYFEEFLYGETKYKGENINLCLNLYII